MFAIEYVGKTDLKTLRKYKLRLSRQSKKVLFVE